MKAAAQQAGEIAQLRHNATEHGRQLHDLQRCMMVRSGQPADDVSQFRRKDRPMLRFANSECAEAMADFCRGIAGKSRDLTPVSDELGGYLLPTELSRELSRMVEAVGFIDRCARRVPIGRGFFRKARGLAGATVYFKTPGAAATPSSPTFGAMDLRPQTLIGLIESTFELMDGNSIDLGNYIATEFAYAIARKEDRTALLGTGIPSDGGITGILESDRVSVVSLPTGKTAFTDVTTDDLAALEAAVADGALENARWLLHRTIKALLKGFPDGTGRSIWQPMSEGEPSTIFGYPHVGTGAMPARSATAADTKFLVLGDLYQGLYVGKCGDLRLDYSDQVAFASGVGVWRAMESIDMAVDGYAPAEIAAHPELGNPLAVLATAAGGA